MLQCSVMAASPLMETVQYIPLSEDNQFSLSPSPPLPKDLVMVINSKSDSLPSRAY